VHQRAGSGWFSIGSGYESFLLSSGGCPAGSGTFIEPDPDPDRSDPDPVFEWWWWMMMILSRIRIRWDSLQVTIKRTWIRIIDRNNEKRTGSGSFIGSGSGSGFRVVWSGIRIRSGGLRITVDGIRIRILSKIDRIGSYGALTCLLYKFFIYTGY